MTRYFAAPVELFDALRLQVMSTLGQPNGRAEQPWPEGITTLALNPHEYLPPPFAALIEYALSQGATEITVVEYQELQPTYPTSD